jgi:hypothetical protein
MQIDSFYTSKGQATVVASGINNDFFQLTNWQGALAFLRVALKLIHTGQCSQFS